MRHPGGPMEPMSLLGSTRHRTSQQSIFRLPQHHMRSLPIHFPLHHHLPLHQPIHPLLPRTIPAQIYQLRPTHSKHPIQPPPPLLRHRPSSSESQVCTSFNAGRCSRQRCRFMHVCNICGSAHARMICPLHKAANKNDKTYLSTLVNIFRLFSEVVHHPDPHFIKYVLLGLSHGFHPGVGNFPSESLICPNLQSALTEPETVNILIKKEIDANFMIGPFSVPPFNIFRVSPIGVATRTFSVKKNAS